LEETKKLLPQVPVLSEYSLVKDELLTRINKLNAITELNKDNEKDVKTGIAEINKVKDRIGRFRIDETARFLEYINPCIEQCKELEQLCVSGISDIKAKVKTLEEQEREQKISIITQLFNFTLEACPFKNLLKFEMFFEPSMANKTTTLTIIEKQLKDWAEAKTSDLNFINRNADDSEAIIAIYFSNGLKLTAAIDEHQQRYKSESEIKAMMATEAIQPATTFEKKVDLTIKINQLPRSKVKALQAFLDGLVVDWEIV